MQCASQQARRPLVQKLSEVQILDHHLEIVEHLPLQIHPSGRPHRTVREGGLYADFGPLHLSEKRGVTHLYTPIGETVSPYAYPPARRRRQILDEEFRARPTSEFEIPEESGCRRHVVHLDIGPYGVGCVGTERRDAPQKHPLTRYGYRRFFSFARGRRAYVAESGAPDPEIRHSDRSRPQSVRAV